MKIHGYCESCHRIRRVDASGHQLAMYVATGRAPSGECDQCREERERPKAKPPVRGMA